MILQLTDDHRFLELVDASELELEQLRISLTKRIKNWRFNPRVQSGGWDGYYCYLIRDRYIPAGLWKIVVDVAKKYNYSIELNGVTQLFDTSINPDEFTEWAKNFFEGLRIKGEPVDLRDYQIETAYRILKFKKCAAELATSAGKTLITFMTLAYMLDKKLANKILVIVPSVSLVTQATDDFIEYNNKNKIKLKIQEIYSGQKIKPESNIVIGTYQSLVKKKPEYFEQFDVVMIDEMHKIKANSIKTILEKCVNVDYRFGLTGTFPKPDTLDRLTIMSYSGPLVNEVSAAFLQKKGYIAQCEVKVIELDYADEHIKKSFHDLYKRSKEDRSKVFNLEQNYVIANPARLAMITNIISKSTKNSLVLFHRLEHGEEIYNRLRQICVGKSIYYVDGSIDSDKREIFKKKMEQNDNIILVASFGTFSTGISVKNIHNIFFTESFKAEIIIRQSIGRGLRQHKNKDKLIIIDFVDNFCYGTWRNYVFKHGIERQNIYAEQQFPYSIKKLKFAA